MSRRADVHLWLASTVSQYIGASSGRVFICDSSGFSCRYRELPAAPDIPHGYRSKQPAGPDILELAYAGNPDPRNSPAIIAALQQAG